MTAGTFAPVEVAYLHTMTPLSERLAGRVVRVPAPPVVPSLRKVHNN